MKSRRFLAVLATGATATALCIGFGVSSAHAETTDVVTETLIDAALADLGTEITDPTLLAELQEDISTAVDEGIIDPAILDEVEQVVTDETPAPEQTSETEPAPLDELINENLDEESANWEAIEPAWVAAFETIRADFELCRTDGQTTSGCARTLGFQLQIALSEAKLAEIDTAIAAAAELPVEEQAAALAQLEAQRAAFQAKLERTAEKLATAAATGNAGADQATQARLNSVIDGVRGRAQTPALPEQAQQGAESSSENPAGPQAETTPEIVTIPDVAVQNSNGQANSGNSGNSGRPANPGSQGQGNSNRNNR